jgi:hypothetical protein
MSALDKLALAGAGIGFLAFTAVLVFYEHVRSKAGRPLLPVSNVIQLYYCAYLSSFVLGVMCLVAAAVK